MRRVEDMVTAHTTFTLRVERPPQAYRRRAHTGVQVRVRMRFLLRDPHAVYLRFSNGAGADVDWVFARRLLAEGLQRQSGQGDVRLAPLPGSRGSVIVVELRGSSGTALCHASAAEIADFLDATERMLPIGAETQVIDMDAALAALLTTDGA